MNTFQNDLKTVQNDVAEGVIDNENNKKNNFIVKENIK